MRKSFVDGVALTTVLLAYPVFQILLIFLDDVETIVRAPAVDHDILDIRILLIEDREYCPFEIRTLVVRGGDDGDARERIHGSVDGRIYKVQVVSISQNGYGIDDCCSNTHPGTRYVQSTELAYLFQTQEFVYQS